MLANFWAWIGRMDWSKVVYQKGRDLFLYFGLAKHSGRQDFLITKKGGSKKKLEDYLIKKGYEWSCFSWIDDDETLSMRKVVKSKYQYHIRLFSDGEIRGHYEYAPDRYPCKHLLESCFEPKKAYFSKLLKDYKKTL